MHRSAHAAERVKPGDHVFNLPFAGRVRTYLVHVPQVYDARKTIPVVVMIHGAGGTSRWTLTETGWDDKVEEEGFLLALPEGTPIDPSKPAKFLTNPQWWNDGSGRGIIGKENHDDVGFLSAMLDDLEKRFHVEAKRIYVTGFSNGAGLTFRLGAELSKRIAAIAPVASPCWLNNPKPERAIPTLYIVGSEDPLFPLEGGKVMSPWTGMSELKLAVAETVALWAGALGQRAKPQVKRNSDGVKVVQFGPSQEGGELVVITIEGLGHHWPGGKGSLSKRIGGSPSNKIMANDAIWDFFKKQSLP